MRVKVRVFILLNFFAWNLWTPSARAAVPQPETLTTILDKAQAVSLTVKKANSKINEMEDGVTLARTNYYPNLSVITSGYSNQILLNQKIYDGGNTIASVDLSESQKKAAEWDKRKDNESLRDRVVAAYYDALFTIQQMHLLESNSRTIAQALAAAENQLKYRAIGRDVLLRAKVEYRRSEANVLEARAAQQLAERRLSLLLLDTNFSLLSLTERMSYDGLPQPIERSKIQAAESLFELSPTMHSLHSNEGILSAQKDLDFSIERPQVSFIASYGANRNPPPMTVDYVYQPGFNVGFQLVLPLFSGFSTVSRRNIYNERKFQLDQDLQNERTNFSFDVRRRVDNLLQDWNDLQAIREEEAASEDVYKEVDRTYHYGLSSPELWFQSRTALETWSLRELLRLRDYWIGYQKLSDLLRQQ